MARTQCLALAVIAALLLLNVCSAARFAPEGLFASSVHLPAGARSSLLSTRLSDMVQRRSLMTTSSSSSYSYGYGYGYGYNYGYNYGYGYGYGYGR